MGKLADKITIVTGGAGKGIGGSVSRLFAEEGAKVVILDVDAEAGGQIVRETGESGGVADFMRTDVTRADEVNKAICEVLSRYRRVDVLVNNVGKSFGVTLEETDDEIIDKTLRVNLLSALLCTKAVLPTMRSRKHGAVIFVSSINALLGGFSEVVYAAAKAALHAMAKSLTADHAPDGTRFNVVCVGSVPSKYGVWEQRETRFPGLTNKLRKLYPLGRLGTPEDVARGILYLASDDASWISGVLLPIDGGLTATGGLPGKTWWESI